MIKLKKLPQVKIKLDSKSFWPIQWINGYYSGPSSGTSEDPAQLTISQCSSWSVSLPTKYNTHSSTPLFFQLLVLPQESSEELSLTSMRKTHSLQRHGSASLVVLLPFHWSELLLCNQISGSRWSVSLFSLFCLQPSQDQQSPWCRTQPKNHFKDLSLALTSSRSLSPKPWDLSSWILLPGNTVLSQTHWFTDQLSPSAPLLGSVVPAHAGGMLDKTTRESWWKRLRKKSSLQLDAIEF